MSAFAPNQRLNLYQFRDGSIAKEWFDAELGDVVRQVASMDDVHNAHARALEAADAIKKRWFVWHRKRKLNDLRQFTQTCTNISHRGFHPNSYDDYYPVPGA